MRNKIRSYKYILILIIVGSIVSVPLFWKNLNVYNGEGVEFISKAYETHTSIKNGENIYVSSSLANGFGYSSSLFSENLSSFTILICKIITNNFVNAYKLVLFLGLIISGILMYIYAKKITKSNNIAVLSGVIYMLIPYHLNTMFISNNLSEFLSFIFIPLVFLGLYNIFNKEKKEWIFVIRIIRADFYKCKNSNSCDNSCIWIYL